jgi:hypothetical protein
MRAAVSVKVGLFKGDVGAAGSVGEKTNSKMLAQFQRKNLTATGGDTRLVENVGDWASSVGPVAHWRVISRDRVVPLYEVLDKELRDRVLEVLEAVDPRFVPSTFDPEPPEPEMVNEMYLADRDGLLVPVNRSPALVLGASAGSGGVPGGPIAFASCPTEHGRSWPHMLTLPVRRGDTYLVESLAGSSPGFPVRFHRIVDVGACHPRAPGQARRSFPGEHR